MLRRLCTVGFKAALSHQQARMIQPLAANQNALIVASQRAFAKRGRKSKKDEGATTEEEHVEETPEVHEEPVQHTPEPVQEKPDFSAATAAQTYAEVPKDLFGAFSVGDVKQIQSAPDHKPPAQDDTMDGRYASVLFTSASQQEALYTIYVDIVYLKHLYDNSESFRLFTQNAGVGMKEVTQFNQALQQIGDFHSLTIKFLEVLAENKRLNFLPGIATKYQKLYQQFNKEEKITIISAEKLSGAEESEVLAALKANPQNAGKEFVLEFTVDPSIKGGLQMYTETEFMDMSLASRLEKVKSEVNKLID